MSALHGRRRPGVPLGRLPRVQTPPSTHACLPLAALGWGSRDPAGTARMLPPPGTGRAWPPLPLVASPARWQPLGRRAAGGHPPSVSQRLPKAQTGHASPCASLLLGKQPCVTPWTVTLPPVSSVHGILQARTLEWVAISFSRRSPRPRNRTWVSNTAGRFFTI